MRFWKQRGRYIKRGASALAVAIFAAVLSAVPTAQVLAQAASGNDRESAFKRAAQEFGVPVTVLMSVSYNQSRWENHKGKPSVSGGYGLMHLTAPSATNTEVEDGRGDSTRALPKRAGANTQRPNTLGDAAKLINTDENTVKSDDKQNIRAAAALLASYAKQGYGGSLPGKTGQWYDAVTRISGMTNPAQSQGFADDVYKTIQNGVQLTTSDKQTLSIAADKSPEARPDKTKTVNYGLAQGADGTKEQERNRQQTECPRDITCKFVPARFAQNNPDDPTDYGNMDTANRPRDSKIKYIVIHDTEGSYQSAIDWFQNPASYVAAHYVIRSSDGEVTQMVKNKDVGWHAGNWYVNTHSIGIEHEGEAAEGGSWYTEAMYRSSAKLVRYLADKYQIPLDRQHIIGHDQVPGINPARVPLMHWDPGPYWDWDYYMDLIRDDGEWSQGNKHNDANRTVQAEQPEKRQARKVEARNSSQFRWGNSKVVKIEPDFGSNQPPVTGCLNGVCIDLPAQGSNFVYLRTAPRADAPLLSDKGLHPDGAPGTTSISDWGARAAAGQKFVVAETRGDWTAVWFSGQKGWFYNPDRWDYTALPSWSKRVTPKAGKDSIPVYGRPIPEASAYTNGVPPLTPAPLQYTISRGQSYTATDDNARNDYYYVSTFDRSNPGDGTIVVGNEKYIPIEYNHREAFVKASDVDMKWY